jgi:hypothetical protein
MSKLNDRVYYFSNYDFQVHNINNVKHTIKNENNDTFAEIQENDSCVIDEVVLHTFDEIIDIFNDNY